MPLGTHDMEDHDPLGQQDAKTMINAKNTNADK